MLAVEAFKDGDYVIGDGHFSLRDEGDTIVGRLGIDSIDLEKVGRFRDKATLTGTAQISGDDEPFTIVLTEKRGWDTMDLTICNGNYTFKGDVTIIP